MAFVCAGGKPRKNPKSRSLMRGTELANRSNKTPEKQAFFSYAAFGPSIELKHRTQPQGQTMTIPKDIRKQAVDAGLPLTVLSETYAEMRQLARLERETGWEIRRRVWHHYAYTVESRSFWRNGMHARFGRAFGEGDMTNIPGWDDVARSMQCEFPELSNVDDISQHLFELIREPHQTMPSACDTWKEAFDLCLERVGDWSVDEEIELAAVPF